MPNKIKETVLDPVRHIRIAASVHKKLRLLAIQRGVTIGQVIAEALKTL